MTKQTKNSTFGMTSTDICRIIKACGENNVYRIKIGDMLIDFSNNGQHTTTNETTVDMPLNIEQASDIIQDEDLYEEDIFDNDLFEDPVAWEEAERQRVNSEQ